MESLGFFAFPIKELSSLFSWVGKKTLLAQYHEAYIMLFFLWVIIGAVVGLLASKVLNYSNDRSRMSLGIVFGILSALIGAFLLSLVITLRTGFEVASVITSFAGALIGVGTLNFLLGKPPSSKELEVKEFEVSEPAVKKLETRGLPAKELEELKEAETFQSNVLSPLYKDAQFVQWLINKIDLDLTKGDITPEAHEKLKSTYLQLLAAAQASSTQAEKEADSRD